MKINLFTPGQTPLEQQNVSGVELTKTLLSSVPVTDTHMAFFSPTPFRRTES